MNSDVINILNDIIECPVPIEVLYSALRFAVELQPDATPDNIDDKIVHHLNQGLQEWDI